MVRFSDMLGGSGDTAGGRATNSPYAALESDKADADEPAADDEPDVEAEAGQTEVDPSPSASFESPEAVLDRLTQYATSARAADHAPLAVPDPQAPAPQPLASDEAETEDEPADGDADDPLSTPGDDFLPRPKGAVRRAGRGRKRRP